MMTVKDLLDFKGRDIWSVSPGSSVDIALGLMAEKEIGAVLIMENGVIEGIFSERDYARGLVRKKDCSVHLPVAEFMTRQVITVKPGFDVFDCMLLMTTKKIRHLPVVEDGKLAGIITIGDVVNSIIRDQAQTIHDLEAYITGKYPQ